MVNTTSHLVDGYIKWAIPRVWVLDLHLLLSLSEAELARLIVAPGEYFGEFLLAICLDLSRWHLRRAFGFWFSSLFIFGTVSGLAERRGSVQFLQGCSRVLRVVHSQWFLEPQQLGTCVMVSITVPSQPLIIMVNRSVSVRCNAGTHHRNRWIIHPFPTATFDP